VLGGGPAQPLVDRRRLARPPGHRAHHERGAQPCAEQLDVQAHVREVALGQRAVAQPHVREPGAAGVRHARAARDAQVVALAGGDVGAGHVPWYGFRRRRAHRGQ
jgi:hypothetical protein